MKAPNKYLKYFCCAATYRENKPNPDSHPEPAIGDFLKIDSFHLKSFAASQLPFYKNYPIPTYSAFHHLKPILHILLKPFFLRPKKGRQVKFSRIAPRSRLVNPQFVSFLESSRFQRISLDKYERKLRRKTVWIRMSILVGVLLFGWLIIESAQALTHF